MAIPEIPAIMLLLLQLAADNDTLRFRDAVDLLAERLRLTEAQRREVMPNGAQRLYYRVSFARGRLKKLGLLEDPARGQFRITELGRRFLRSNPSRVDLKSIRQFDGSGDGLGDGPGPPPPDEVPTVTPEETLQDAYETLRKSLLSTASRRVSIAARAVAVSRGSRGSFSTSWGSAAAAFGSPRVSIETGTGWPPRSSPTACSARSASRPALRSRSSGRSGTSCGPACGRSRPAAGHTR